MIENMTYHNWCVNKIQMMILNFREFRKKLNTFIPHKLTHMNN